MKKRMLLAGVIGIMLLGLTAGASAQKDPDEPTALLSFVVVKEDNGKPVRNAAVIMHPVNSRGKQGHGGMELKTDSEGKSSFDGIPFGRLRVQVLASGFQTYGEDFEVNQPAMRFTIKLKRPQGQYSIYEDHTKDTKNSDPPKQEAAPPPDKSSDKKSDKPN
jgi:hypothetical protein